LKTKETDKASSFAKELIDRRTAEGAEPQADMMQAFIRSGMTKEELMQQVYIHL
jgi:hypothetical protein